MTRWAYTRDVAFLAKRLTTIATVFALSGSPAALYACMALCLQAAPMAAMAHEHGAPVPHAAPVPAVAAGHAHHTSPAAPESSDARLGATCHDCCPDGVAVVIGLGAERTDTHACGATPMVVAVAHFLLTTSVLGAAPHGPPASPPASPRAPLVLRV